MDYLPEVARAGNVNGLQKALEKCGNGRAVTERCGKLRSTSSSWEFKVAPQNGPLLFVAKLASQVLCFKPTGGSNTPVPILQCLQWLLPLGSRTAFFLSLTHLKRYSFIVGSQLLKRF